MAVRYGDIATLLPDADGELSAFLDRHLSVHGKRFFAPSGERDDLRITTYHEDKVVVPVGLPNWPDAPAPRLNTLYWPTGASRWAHCLLLADNVQKDAIVNLANVGSPARLATGLQLQILGEHFTGTAPANGFSLAPTVPSAPYAPREVAMGVEMFLLKPQPVSMPLDNDEESSNSSSGSDEQTAADRQLWILPLVDKRYFWQWKWIENLGEESGAENWEETLEYLCEFLGSSQSATLNAVWNWRPDFLDKESLAGMNAAVLLDAVAMSVGHRVVRDFDGTLQLRSPSSASSVWSGNLVAENYTPPGVWSRIAGGTFHGQPGSAAIPQSVTILFSDRDTRTVSQSDIGVNRGYAAGFSRRVRVPYFSVSSEATADAEKTAIAERIAADFFGWIAKSGDMTYAGVKAWSMTGFEDYLEFEFGSPGRSGLPWLFQTRIVTMPENWGITTTVAAGEGGPAAYLIRIPCGETIPAAAGDIAGRVTACLFKIVADGVIEKVLEENGDQKTAVVHNPFEFEVGDGCFLPVVRESSGKWVLTTPDCPVTQADPDATPEGACLYEAQTVDDEPVWVLLSGSCAVGYECDPPPRDPTEEQALNAARIYRECIEVETASGTCVFEAREVSGNNRWVQMASGCGAGMTCDPPPRNPTSEQVAGSAREETECVFDVSGPSPSFCTSVSPCEWEWSEASQRWNQTGGECAYNPDPDPVEEESSNSSSSSPESSQSCHCVIHEDEDDEESSQSSASSESSSNSSSQSQSSDSSSADDPCRCQYPNFCGSFDGECTVTYCSHLDSPTPEACGPEDEESSLSSQSSSSSLSSADCENCFAEDPPCDCVCHWRVGIDRLWHLESITGSGSNFGWLGDDIYDPDYYYHWRHCYNCSRCGYPQRPPILCGETETTYCRRTKLTPPPAISCVGSCRWEWLFWDPGWKYAGNGTDQSFACGAGCGCSPPSSPGPVSACAIALTPCVGPGRQPPPMPCACRCAEDEPEEPDEPVTCEGTCIATYDPLFEVWSTSGDCGEDCECETPTDHPACAMSREVPCLPILPDDESSSSSQSSSSSSPSSDSSSSPSSPSSQSSQSSPSSDSSPSSLSSDSSSLSSPSSNSSQSSGSSESSGGSSGCDCCLIGEIEWTGQWDAVNQALSEVLYDIGINRSLDDEGIPCDISDTCKEVENTDIGIPAGHMHKGTACIEFVGDPVNTVVITLTLEAYDIDPGPPVLISGPFTQIITLSVDPEMPCETTGEEPEDQYAWVIESNAGTELIDDIEVSTIGMLCDE